MIIRLKEVNKLRFEERMTFLNWIGIWQNRYQYSMIVNAVFVCFYTLLILLSNSLFGVFSGFTGLIVFLIITILDNKNWKNSRKEIIDEYFNFSVNTKRRKK